MDPGAFGSSRPGLDLRFIVGERDTWITSEVREAERARLGAAGLPFHLETFAGGHRLDSEKLRELGQG
jgi:dienelactone hydrolase